MKTIGQRKTERERQKDLGEDIRTPSYYGKGMVEALDNEVSAIPDKQVKTIHRETVRALEANRADIHKVNEVRKANLQDPTKTRTAALVDAYEFGEEAQERIYKRSVGMESRLNELKINIKNGIDSDIEKLARKSRQGGKIQDYLLNMKDKSERLSFLRKASRDGDKETLAVIISGMPYLSGLDKEDIEILKERYIKNNFQNQYTAMQHVERLAENVGKGFITTQSNMKPLETSEVKQAIHLREQARKARNFDS